MDYREEQIGEIEALESIYCGELEILGTDPHKFCIEIKSLEYDKEKGEGLACTMKFTYTEKYPDELPILEVIDYQNFSEADERRLLEHVVEQAKENVGMVMVFTIVSAVQEWMSCRWEEIKQNKELEAEKRLKETEEEERKRVEGTKVTVETFMMWKKAFIEEIGLNKRDMRDEREGRKLTGRELFLQDQTLIDSDLKFLEDSGETIKVDESLFQDLDDLDLNEDELSDD